MRFINISNECSDQRNFFSPSPFKITYIFFQTFLPFVNGYQVTYLRTVFLIRSFFKLHQGELSNFLRVKRYLIHMMSNADSVRKIKHDSVRKRVWQFIVDHPAGKTGPYTRILFCRFYYLFFIKFVIFFFLFL